MHKCNDQQGAKCEIFICWHITILSLTGFIPHSHIGKQKSNDEHKTPKVSSTAESVKCLIKYRINKIDNGSIKTLETGNIACDTTHLYCGHQIGQYIFWKVLNFTVQN